jgi:hypothetical protein
MEPRKKHSRGEALLLNLRMEIGSQEKFYRHGERPEIRYGPNYASGETYQISDISRSFKGT